MNTSRLFQHYVGIDYSGAATPTTRLRGLRVFRATPSEDSVKVHPPNNEGRNWTRKEIAHWCVDRLQGNHGIIIGIDHAFSFPIDYMVRNKINNWHHFLSDFCKHWPTHLNNNRVADLRENNHRSGSKDEFRLTEKWTSSAKSVFRFDIQGQVAMSSHAGIPWLKCIIEQVGDSAQFWPFDGFEIPPGKSVVAEVYPAIFKKRYESENRTGDEHDAYSIAMWLKQMDGRGALERYFNPPLSPTECKQAELEGWILGIC